MSLTKLLRREIPWYLRQTIQNTHSILPRNGRWQAAWRCQAQCCRQTLRCIPRGFLRLHSVYLLTVPVSASFPQAASAPQISFCLLRAEPGKRSTTRNLKAFTCLNPSFPGHTGSGAAELGDVANNASCFWKTINLQWLKSDKMSSSHPSFCFLIGNFS